MRPYSLDLRERILAAVDDHDGSIRWIARIFRVSTSFIVRLLQRRGPPARWPPSRTGADRPRSWGRRIGAAGRLDRRSRTRRWSN